ncbi:MAG: hypothetical protein EAX96_05730 [Candidatus Lokiarchaeota archaeon]|nr:hypothetical protein [Candidatus Lokiarchaeota archaeon]
MYLVTEKEMSGNSELFGTIRHALKEVNWHAQFWDQQVSKTEWDHVASLKQLMDHHAIKASKESCLLFSHKYVYFVAKVIAAGNVTHKSILNAMAAFNLPDLKKSVNRCLKKLLARDLIGKLVLNQNGGTGSTEYFISEKLQEVLHSIPIMLQMEEDTHV